MLDNHELNLFLVSTYLIYAIRPVFIFLSGDLNMKISRKFPFMDKGT